MRGTTAREPDVEHIIVDGARYDLLDPAVVTREPDADSAWADPDAAAAAASVVNPTGSVLGAVKNLQAARLSDTGLVDAMVACERLKAVVEAKQAEFLNEISNPDPVGTGGTPANEGVAGGGAIPARRGRVRAARIPGHGGGEARHRTCIGGPVVGHLRVDA